jgi:hypothetical protein
MSRRDGGELSPTERKVMKQSEEQIEKFLRLFDEMEMKEGGVRSLLAAIEWEHNKRTRDSRALRLAEEEQESIRVWKTFKQLGKPHERISSLFESYHEAIQGFYKHPRYGVERAELELVYVLNEGMLTREQFLEVVTSAFQCVIATENKRTSGEVVISEEYYDRISRRIPYRRERSPKDDVYVLCGVHDGSETHGLSFDAVENYFKEQERVGLTLYEGLSLFARYPNLFCGKEQCGVVLLGELYSGFGKGNDKFAALYYDAKIGLNLFLVTQDEAIASFRSSSSPSAYKTGETMEIPNVSFGKPSAKHVLAHSHQVRSE